MESGERSDGIIILVCIVIMSTFRRGLIPFLSSRKRLCAGSHLDGAESPLISCQLLDHEPGGGGPDGCLPCDAPRGLQRSLKELVAGCDGL